jgi:hypothetical protein
MTQSQTRNKVGSEIFTDLTKNLRLGDDKKRMDPNYIGRDMTEE